ncbi:MAG: tRNA lysidine(34) synthetase TilS [Chitinophagales bacterium]
MLNKVWQFMVHNEMILPGESVVVGVSGGPDSVALLHFLLQLKKQGNYEVFAAHLNHGLREEALLDQELVEGLCRKWDVPFRMDKSNIKEIARTSGQSIEQVGREVRYRFLHQTAEEFGAVKIAVAHHRQDQAETLLMRLIQGTGPRGLQAMLPRRSQIIRPFLCLDRNEIDKYLKENHIDYRIDSSNFDKNYLRNRIRLDLLPLLEERFNPRIVDGLCRLADLAAEENLYWESEIEKVINQVANSNSSTVNVNIDKLKSLHPVLGYRLIQKVLYKSGAERLSHNDLDRVMKLTGTAASGRRVKVSGGLLVTRSFNNLEIGQPRTQPDFCYQLQIPGEVYVAEMSAVIKTRIVKEIQTPGKNIVYLDWDQVQKPLYIRSRRTGDHLNPVGMTGSKKVKDILIEARVPASQRGGIGILASDSEIYWVVGIKLDGHALVTSRTTESLEVSVRQEPAVIAKEI